MSIHGVLPLSILLFPLYCQNSSVTQLNATVTQMDVEDSSSAFAPAASDAVVLVHVPDPVQPFFGGDIPTAKRRYSSF